MTDKFEVPEPSEEAYTKFFERTDDKWLTHLSNCLRAAYAVDIPRIVREEVERALQWVHPGPEDVLRRYWGDALRYLAARFGEAAPEEEPIASCCHSAFVMGCEHCATVQRAVNRITRETLDRVPTPSAPAVRIDGVLHDTNLRNTCVRCTWMPDGSLAGRCERCGQSQAVDDSENDRLARMERFLTALADWLEVGTLVVSEERHRKAVSAAREYLR